MKRIRSATLAGVRQATSCSAYVPFSTPQRESFPPASVGGQLRLAVTSLPVAGSSPCRLTVGSDVTSVTHSVARFGSRKTRFTKGVSVMASHARLADVAVETAMDAQMRAKAAARVIDEALADGEVTPAEARAMLMYARQTVKAAEDVVQATERTNVAEKAAVSLLSGFFNTHVRRQADEVGLVLQFPTVEPDSAA